MRARLASFWSDQAGSSAVELVLVLPLCVFMILGTITLSIALYAQTTLHSTVESAARYASTYTARNTISGVVTYPSSTAITAYAASIYQGPGLTITWTYYQPNQVGNTCASTAMHQVKATASYTLNTGLVSPTFPLNAASCFP